MNVKELKTSLQRLGSDFDDIHVIIKTSDKNKEVIFDLATFVGYHSDFSAVVIGGWNETVRMAEEGKVPIDIANKIKEMNEEFKDKLSGGNGNDDKNGKS